MSNENIIEFPILDGEEAKLWDNFSIENKGVESRLLMGWAGYSVFLEILQKPWFVNAPEVHILAGSGNNGGDGYVLAWHILSATKKKITVWRSSEPATEDSKYFFKLCESVNLPDSLQLKSLHTIIEHSFIPGELVVDAVFGTGLNKPLAIEMQNIFTRINSQKEITRIAIDIASGIYANGDFFYHEVFQADYTYTFGSYKICHLVEPGILKSGNVTVFPIGFFPYEFKNRRRIKHYNISPVRKLSGHKYDSGSLSIIGGSTGMEGAAVMAAQAFLSLGGGLAKIYSMSEDAKKALNESPELMIHTYTSITALEKEILENLRQKTKNQSLVIGVGLKEALSSGFWLNILNNPHLRIIVDGSGLSQLSLHENLFQSHNLKSLILTPHRAEAEKLLGKPVTNIRKDALEISKKFKANVYLKGPGGIIVIHSVTTGNRTQEIYPGSKHYELSTGGTGDVLCGVIAGMLSRLDPHDGLEAGLQVYLDAAQNVIKNNLYNKDFLTTSELMRELRGSIITSNLI